MKSILITLWLIAMAAALALALLPDPLKTGPYADEMFHIAASCVFMLLPACRYETDRPVMLWLILLLLAGVAIELVQGLFPAREVSLTDLLCNALGAALGIIIGRLLRRGYHA